MDFKKNLDIASKSRALYKFCPYKFYEVEPTNNDISGKNLPKPRSGHRIVCDERNIYSFGGFSRIIEITEKDFKSLDSLVSCPVFNELWQFNLASRTWVKLETHGAKPKEAVSHVAILLPRFLLVYGGTGVPFGVARSNSIYVCNLKSLEWRKVKAKGEHPLKLYGQACAAYHGGLYVVGGTSGSVYHLDVHRLDLTTCSWDTLCTESHPKSSYRHEIVIYHNKLYVLGGGTDTICFSLSNIPVFSLECNMWSEEPVLSPEYPAARRCHSCVNFKSNAFICGGFDGENIYSDIWKLDLELLMWAKLPYSLPHPVYFHSSALSPIGQMFIFGGITSVESRTNKLYSVWVTIPLLKELCWQSILYYLPNITSISVFDLMELGLPQEYLKRVNFDKEADEWVMVNSP